MINKTSHNFYPISNKRDSIHLPEIWTAYYITSLYIYHTKLNLYMINLKSLVRFSHQSHKVTILHSETNDIHFNLATEEMLYEDCTHT
jgi:hypothetical protein